MARKSRIKTKSRKRVKGKVKLTQRARIVEKNDDTRVARRDTLKKAPVKPCYLRMVSRLRLKFARNEFGL
jgi:hypothetical protein